MGRDVQRRPSPPVIGLTGGAGSGKSAVAALFRRRGARVVDADRLGHRLLRRGSPCHEKIVATFGEGVRSRGGAVDRGKLGALVFGDKRELAKLNSIVHPELLKNIKRQISRFRKTKSGPVVVEAALLVDWGLHREMDRTIVVEAPLRLRLERLAKRGVPLARARAVIASQLPAGRLRRAADEVLDNSGTPAELGRAAARAWSRIEKMVEKRGRLR